MSDPIAIAALNAFEPSDWSGVRAAFRGAAKLCFRQAWRATPEARFRKGYVRLGWREDRLFYLAELDDPHPFTTASRRNQKLWMAGDVLECFVGLTGEPGYIEYHTAPNGLLLQLAWPTPEAHVTASSPHGLRPFKRLDHASTAIAAIHPRGWRVLGSVAGRALGLAPGETLCGRGLDINFGRYDYWPDLARPVLSSTSPLTFPAFHRREEWLRALPVKTRQSGPFPS